MIIVGILLTLVGLLILIAFAVSRISCRTPIEAVVSKVLVSKRPGRGRTISDYTPVFSYEVEGKTYSGKADSSTTDVKRFTVGQRVSIFIDPAHPAKFRYGSNVGFLLAGLVITALGVLFIVLFFL